MSITLLIVESPTKAKTLQGFLGPKYKVLSSYGHVRDLPKSELGVDIEKKFQPKYIIPAKARKNLKILIEAVKKTDSTILATDEDREGEAISWHLIKALKLDGDKEPYQRIVFHEITKQAIEEALKNPRKIDMNLVDAQQARRVLDRIVGYKLSPFLWKKVARGLSAGRVQSVAVRIVVEREREIEKFKAEEYWTIAAIFLKDKEFEAVLIKKNGEVLDKMAIKNEKEAGRIVKELEGVEYEVENIEKKATAKNPFPPFTTSTLQQEAWRKFKFPAKFTMRLAQNLYEKGFITYHRTDSLNLSDLALGAAKKFITENYGENYYQFRKYKAKGRAQEAHEAIRPAYPERTQVETDEPGAKLYDLIWKRFIACQMSQASFDSTTVDIKTGNPKSEARNPKYTFRAAGQILRFDGFLKVYPIKYEETELPLLEKNELLKLLKLNPLQHSTQPPARYTEATLIKALESEGIGRPSTYAPTISTIQERNYIEKNERKFFRPTEIGIVVNDLLVKHFPEIVDIKFTASMEEDLDKIADGEKKWVKVLEEFYGPFEKNLEQKYKDVSKKEYTEEPTNKKCPKCGSPLLIRMGRYGKFYACSKFPECKHTESLPQNVLNVKCPKCADAASKEASFAPSERGQLVEKRTSKRKIFYGCNQYPKCDFALWDKPMGEKCPKCNSLLVETKRKQIKCSSKECDYVKQ